MNLIHDITCYALISAFVTLFSYALVVWMEKHQETSK